MTADITFTVGNAGLTREPERGAQMGFRRGPLSQPVHAVGNFHQAFTALAIAMT
jgi:hypothetical protein